MPSVSWLYFSIAVAHNCFPLFFTFSLAFIPRGNAWNKRRKANEEKSRAFDDAVRLLRPELGGAFSVAYEISENRRVKESRRKRNRVCGLRKPSTEREPTWHGNWDARMVEEKGPREREKTRSRPGRDFIWLQAVTVSFFISPSHPSLFSRDACIMQLALPAGRVLITAYMHNKEKPSRAGEDDAQTRVSFVKSRYIRRSKWSGAAGRERNSDAGYLPSHPP